MIGTKWSRLPAAARAPVASNATTALLATLVALGGMALYVNARSKAADRANPPSGRFVDVDGVRLHYVMRGEGAPVVLLHGNGSMTDEIESSGLVDLLAENRQVIVFDRPGFGDSDRPRGRRWGAKAQARLVTAALARLGIERATIVGHSWGTLVALALALDHPRAVQGLVLVSGYYYPTFRPDAFMLSAPSWPIIGPLLSHTTSPLIARLMWRGLVRIAFGPPDAPDAFERLPRWRFLAPSRIRASAEESGMLVGEAAKLESRYGEIRTPTVILAGEDDRIVRLGHAQRLQRAIAGSTLQTVAGVGHMLHHIVPRQVARAVDIVAGSPVQRVRATTSKATMAGEPAREAAAGEAPREATHRDDAFNA